MVKTAVTNTENKSGSSGKRTRRTSSYKTKTVLSKKPNPITTKGRGPEMMAPLKYAKRYLVKMLRGGMHSDLGPLLTNPETGKRKNTQWEWAGPGDIKYIAVGKAPFFLTNKEAFELANYYATMERRVAVEARGGLPGETYLSTSEGNKFWVEEQELDEDEG